MADALEVVFRSAWTFMGTLLLVHVFMSHVASIRLFSISRHYHDQDLRS